MQEIARRIGGHEAVDRIIPAHQHAPARRAGIDPEIIHRPVRKHALAGRLCKDPHHAGMPGIGRDTAVNLTDLVRRAFKQLHEGRAIMNKIAGDPALIIV